MIDQIENLEVGLSEIASNESRLKGIMSATTLVSILVGVVSAYLVCKSSVIVTIIMYEQY